MDKIKKIINRETIAYLVVGVLTTVTDWVVFVIINEMLKAKSIGPSATVTIATALSWFIAVIFAYIANKLVVFGNYDFGFSHVIKEAGAFFLARIFSGLIVLLLMWIFTVPFSINEYIAKAGTSVFNIVFNYVASKVFIFKKKSDDT